MATFEEGFAASEEAADSVLAALGEMSRLVRRIKRGARDGNIAALRREVERLDAGIEQVRDRADEVSRAWPFSTEEEVEYLRDSYANELMEHAEHAGLDLFHRDDRLIAHPSILRVLAGDRAIRVDHRRSVAVRPTRVVTDLTRAQERPARFRPQPFLQALYDAYVELCHRDSSAGRFRLQGVGQVIPLDRIYRLFTGLPGTGRDYTQLDFARDLYELEESGVREVRSGGRVSFPASTGTRAPRGTISFIDPRGEQVVYYGIQFSAAGG